MIYPIESPAALRQGVLLKYFYRDDESMPLPSPNLYRSAEIEVIAKGLDSASI